MKGLIVGARVGVVAGSEIKIEVCILSTRNFCGMNRKLTEFSNYDTTRAAESRGAYRLYAVFSLPAYFVALVCCVGRTIKNPYRMARL